jgi:hypothetical protein
MRALRLLLYSFCAATLLGASDRPKVDGKVRAVSKADVELIAAAAKSWLQKMHALDPSKKTVDRLTSIHVLNSHTAEVHLKQEYPRDRSFIEETLTVRSVNRSWRADDYAQLNTWGSL